MATTSYASPVGGSGGTPGSYPVFHMPAAVVVARGFQLFVALVVLGLAGSLMHGIVLSAYAFSFVCGLFTLVVAVYALLTEKARACRAAYNYWAVLSLDLLLVVFWLASMGAVAALRGTFQYDTVVSCYDDGSAVNAEHCYTERRRRALPLAPRYAVASRLGLAEMSTIAGLSALEMLLFVASFAYLAHQLRLHRQAQKAGVASDDAGVVEMKVHAAGGGGGGGGGAINVPPTAPLAGHDYNDEARMQSNTSPVYQPRPYESSAPQAPPPQYYGQPQQQQQQQQPHQQFAYYSQTPAASHNAGVVQMKVQAAGGAGHDYSDEARMQSNTSPVYHPQPYESSAPQAPPPPQYYGQPQQQQQQPQQPQQQFAYYSQTPAAGPPHSYPATH